MNIETKLEKCAPDDPNRCQTSAAGGQCQYLAVPGQQYCSRHGGRTAATNQELQKSNQYRIQLWQRRLDEFSETEDIKSLRGEIAILRHLTESICNQCKSHTDLILYSGRIGDMIMKIEKCVTSCDKLDSKMGLVLDKTAALTLASRVVEVITSHVTDPDVVDRISAGIIDILGAIGKGEP